MVQKMAKSTTKAYNAYKEPTIILICDGLLALSTNFYALYGIFGISVMHLYMAKVECSNAQLTANLTSKFERNLQSVLRTFVMKIRNFTEITQFLY